MDTPQREASSLAHFFNQSPVTAVAKGRTQVVLSLGDTISPAIPHIVKRGGLWACWTTPGDFSMPARQARDWVRLANFKLENAP